MLIQCSSVSQVIGCEASLQNDLNCIGWGAKLYALIHSAVDVAESIGGIY